MMAVEESPTGFRLTNDLRSVGKRSRTGDWEIDTGIGNSHCGALVSLAKRKSRLSLIARLASKSAGGVKPAVIDWLSPLKAKVCTLTSNQGKEFTEHKSKVKNLEAKFFFAHPYA